MTQSKSFVISQVFPVTREQVYGAWVDAKQLEKWFGPAGVKLDVASADIRPGGEILYKMTTPDGTEMWGKWTFRELDSPGRIVLVNSFSNAEGGLGRHPLAPDWPPEMLSTTTFETVEGGTQMTISWAPLNPTPAEQACFDSSHDGMMQGWGGTLKQLTDYLDSL